MHAKPKASSTGRNERSKPATTRGHDQRPPHRSTTPAQQNGLVATSHELVKMLTAIIIVARVQPGTSKGITDLLLPQPSSGLNTSAVPLVYLSQREQTRHKGR